MANKKINQLVSKTSILSTDLFGIGDATTGQLFKKTIAELQAAIGGAVISVNGLVGTVVLDTDDIQELATPTNKYFTDARARGAISLTVTGNSGASTYSSGTGVLNVPTYTLAGLGGITASFLSGTSGISYNSTTGVISYSGTVYTDSSIRALLSGGTGITYNSSTGAISYSGTVYTDSSVRALISLTTTGTSGASTYNNTTGVINVPNYTLAGLGGITASFLSGGTGITYNSSTGAISYSGTVYTDSSIRGLISATGNISYNNTTGVISTSLTQYTDALARASISAGTGISYNSTTGVITNTITQYTDALARASVSLTTTGTSGASTYNSTTGVFNIPNYGSALSGYLPLTGGTLTGALGGTSASFSGNLVLSGSDARINGGDSVGRLLLTNSNTTTYIGLYGATHPTLPYIFSLVVNSATAVTIASNGDATFSSAVKARGYAILEASVSRGGLYPYNLVQGSGTDYSMGIFSESAIFFASGGSVTKQGVITNGGNWLLGTTSDNGERLYVSGAIRATGTITANSDISLKKNLLRIENALEKVEQINGYTYELKEDDSKRHAGVIAQEIQTVLPEIVNTGNDGLMGVEYGNISALLIEAIKEQNTKIKNLETLLASK